jgi:ABC-type polysaccharide/polyol phosphate transport system ATPase subunit
VIVIEDADFHPPIAHTTSLRASLKRIGSRAPAVTYPVLSGINLDLGEGTRLGLIGPNGAGKSSLLRMMAGVFEPTAGLVRRSGKVLTLFDLHFGMDDEASGYKNLEIAGALLEIGRRNIQALVPEIEEFSELGDALGRPVKSYSSGMRVRLAYTLVTCLQAENLLVDEIIGVGDAAFLKKARARMQEKMDKTKLLALASHADSVLRDFCTTGIVMEKGRIILHDEIGSALDYYNRKYA